MSLKKKMWCRSSGMWRCRTHIFYRFINCMELSPSWNANKLILSCPKFRSFMEPEISLPCLQEAATWAYSEPVIPLHVSSPYCLRVHFNIILSTPRTSKWSLPYIFPANSSEHCRELQINGVDVRLIISQMVM